jgi:hypothetical protein
MAADTHAIFPDPATAADPTGQVWAQYGFGEPRAVKLEADRLVLKVGSVGVDLSHIGVGRITVDGRSLKCTRLEVVCVPGRMPEVVAHVLPVPAAVLDGAAK